MNEEINKIISWIEMSYTRLNYKEELLLVNYIKQLQQENKQLKKQLEEYKLITIDYQELEARNQQLKEVIDKAIEYIEYNNETLYTYEPDYDYEENIVINYDVSSFREDLLKILKRGEIND